jgi:hypothetical protein
MVFAVFPLRGKEVIIRAYVCDCFYREADCVPAGLIPLILRGREHGGEGGIVVDTLALVPRPENAN